MQKGFLLGLAWNFPLAIGHSIGNQFGMPYECKPIELIDRNCEVCGTAFTFNNSARGRKRTFCSASCNKAVNNRSKRVIPCEMCGEGFRPPYGALPQYCSHACHKATTKLYPNRKARRATEASRRRARLRAVAVIERFTKRSVYERDGWVCGICHEPVDPTLRHPHHMAASLDHIIPISRGGDHTFVNCQCAHWLCNSLRQDGDL